MMQNISLIVIEDRPLCRFGIKRVFETQTDMTLIGEYGTVEEVPARELLGTTDVVILGLNGHNNAGESVARIATALPESRIVVLASAHLHPQASALLRSGASAYQTKDLTPEALMRVVHDVMNGEIVILEEKLPREQKLNWLLDQYRQAAARDENVEPISTPLTDRELQVLTLIVKGCSNKEVAHLLHISPQTVKNHVTSILRKLNVSDRTQAVVYAVRRGWIELEEPILEFYY
ncbi:MAG: response regulator transcription factor [Anaerolineales bacterium]|nr:response regulator transcription factor [Anaerolineales bacterium]